MRCGLMAQFIALSLSLSLFLSLSLSVLHVLVDHNRFAGSLRLLGPTLSEGLVPYLLEDTGIKYQSDS